MDLDVCKKHCCNNSECKFIAYAIKDKSCWMSKTSTNAMTSKQNWARGIFDTYKKIKCN